MGKGCRQEGRQESQGCPPSWSPPRCTEATPKPPPLPHADGGLSHQGLLHPSSMETWEHFSTLVLRPASCALGLCRGAGDWGEGNPMPCPGSAATALGESGREFGPRPS